MNDNVYDFLAPCIYEGEGEVLGMAFLKSLVKEHGKQFFEPVGKALTEKIETQVKPQYQTVTSPIHGCIRAVDPVRTFKTAKQKLISRINQPKKDLRCNTTSLLRPGCHRFHSVPWREDPANGRGNTRARIRTEAERHFARGSPLPERGARMKQPSLPGCRVSMCSGYDRCNNTGHRGRMGIYELISMNDNLRDLSCTLANITVGQPPVIRRQGRLRKPYAKVLDQDEDEARSILDIAERRLPQDGRIELNVGGNPVDMRVSVRQTQSRAGADRSGFHRRRSVVGNPRRSHKHDTKVLDQDDTTALKSITPDRCQQELQEVGGADFAIKDTDGYRFRVAIFKQRGNIGLVLRRIPSQFRQDDQSRQQDELSQGELRPAHDHAGRPDRVRPQAQEVRHLETIHATIEAAKTGHIVFGTLHTKCLQHHQPNHRRVPQGTAGPDSPPVVAAYEMVTTTVIQNLIRENKTSRM